MIHRNLPRLFLLSLAVLGLVAFAAQEEAEVGSSDRDEGTGDDGEGGPGEGHTIVDLAAAREDLGTLNLALKTAGLVETLEGAGPYTLFAPTDEAFGALGEELDRLLANPTRLREVISHHVVARKLTGEDLEKTDSADALAGGALAFSRDDGLRVNGARVVTKDLTAANGIVHTVDRVLGVGGESGATPDA
jgi:transforming growth factor-beta-induced protein